MLPQNPIEKVVRNPELTQFEATDPGTILVNMAIGLAFALVLRAHFQIFGSSLSNRREFSRTFPMILMTTVLIISIVKHSWQLGLGLVGALSIVRFRTPIKEPEELAYLFLAIGTGIGLGSDLKAVTATAVTAILVAMAIVHWTQRDRAAKGLFLSVEWSEPQTDRPPLAVLTETIGRHASGNDLRRVDRQSHHLDATFFVDIDSMNSLSDLLVDLERNCPGAAVTVIDQNRLPSV